MPRVGPPSSDSPAQHGALPELRPRYARVLAALAHPVRYDLIDALGDFSAASPSELAARIGQPLPHVVHHMRRLVDLGCVELVERRAGAGGVRTFYRSAEQMRLDSEDLGLLGPMGRKRLIESTIAHALTDIRTAARQGAFDRDAEFDFERRTVELDEPGRRELDACATALAAGIERLVAAAFRRLEARPATPSRPALAIVLSFRTRAPQPARPGRSRDDAEPPR